jgi:hypothetical protein
MLPCGGDRSHRCDDHEASRTSDLATIGVMTAALRLVGRPAEPVAENRLRYLVRVTVPDRPGSLGDLAKALGRAGADIASITVVERDDFDAVDDIVVELPPTSSLDDLYAALHTVAGIWVESLFPEPDSTGLNGATGLLATLAVIAADSGRAADTEWRTLIEGLPPVLGATWAALWPASGLLPAVLASPGTPQPPPTGLASSTGALAATAGRLWPSESVHLGLEVGVVPFGTTYALGVGRRAGPPLRGSELAILEHVAAVAGALLGEPPRNRGT